MVERVVDCRGLACPAPVLKTKEVLEKERPDRISVRVDNPAARENVSRFLSRQGFGVTVSEDSEGYLVVGSRLAGASDLAPGEEEILCTLSGPSGEKLLVLIGTDKLGRGNDELGQKLMTNFIKTLGEMVPQLWRLVFLNAGVKLTVKGSPVLDDLKELERQGVSILVCGTCLDFYGLIGEKQVGETTNMLDIVTSMQVAGKVVTVT
ncbi:sulfurtransferase-like selenium metabolism protein YedF [Thermodesulforhabdus norvegica]|uniref:Selenium metabolism protein YedF n=1 Tax=Thermodesulforhabdus norvegica TaxID=39841 RepID=A0A1I4V0E3_9BACT|nr:sulfurtransferase-like selenium metabolism protein YedF [Thermodesulforhabdus norvegica]SFM94749.1 selenium metabolism protein YedF [Thermodesulforhabdus norvegica]